MSNQPPTPEPSVLDFVKSWLAFWNPAGRLDLPPLAARPAETTQNSSERQEPDALDAVETARPEPVFVPKAAAVRTPHKPLNLPRWTLIALLLALAAQLSLEPRPDRGWAAGTALYLMAAVAGILAWRREEWTRPADSPVEGAETNMPKPGVGRIVRVPLLAAAVGAGAAAFFLFSGNLFNQINVAFWLISLILLAAAFWQVEPGTREKLKRAGSLFSQLHWSIHFDLHVLLLAAALIVAVAFHTARLAGTPAEMISEHAERLVDTTGLQQGLASTGFARSTGNEYLQVYLTAAVAALFQTGLTFLSLKVASVLCGLLTLPFIYLLGKELAGRRAGLMAMALAGVAYWPLVSARSGFNFVLYPFFLAPALYFMVRGLQSLESPQPGRIDQNAFVMAGLFVGLGLSGYSAFQIVPLLVILAVILFLFQTRSPENAGGAILGLLIVLLVAFFVYLPGLRFTLDQPETFVLLSLYRTGNPLPPVSGSPWVVFFGNLWNALRMFAWDNGDNWSVAVARRPALDMITAGLFHLGVLWAALSYISRRRWQELLLLISVPVLLLPSVLALGYPAENPALNRSAGAALPVLLLAGMALDACLRGVERRMQRGNAWLAGLAALLLFFAAALQNYGLVFYQFAESYQRSSWNTSEIGGVVRSFASLNGTEDTSWLVGYPYWVDSRLVMINAGFPQRDNGILPDQLINTTIDPRFKLFILNPQDQASLASLQAMYPQGWLQPYTSKDPLKDFWLYYAPPNSTPKIP